MKARKDRIVAAQSLTTQATLDAAKTWFCTDKPRIWVVVGDRAQVSPQLDALGWKVEWVTPSEALLGTF